MSNAVFPTLPGVAWPAHRSPMFNNKRQTAVSGRELAFTYQQYPLYKFKLDFEFLRDGFTYLEYDQLLGFWLSRQGSFESFLFTDWCDNTVTDMQFGAGDGLTAGFQLTRATGGGGFTFSEPVQNVNALSNIKIAGVTKASPTDYSINSTGFVTFVTPPASGAALTWSGTFYYRCRFMKDEQDFSNFMQNLWEAKSLEFKGAPGNLV